MAGVLNSIFKGIQILEAGINVAQVMQDKNATKADKVMACLQGAFAVAQLSDIGIRSSNLSSRVKFGSAIVTGALDVSRTTAKTYASRVKAGQKWTSTDTFTSVLQGTGVVLFRFGDIVDTARGLSACPNHISRCDRLQNFADTGAQVGMALATVVALPTSVRAAYSAIQNYRNNRVQGRAQVIQMTPRQYAGAGPGPGIDPRLGAGAGPVGLEAPPEQDQRMALQEIQRLFRYASNVDSLNEIPKCIADDLRLIHHCPITERPIRYIVKLRLNEDASDQLHGIVYERSALEQWLKERPNETPPEWPVREFPLPLKREYFEVSHARQRDINNSLRAIIRDLQKEFLVASSESEQQRKEELAG